MVKHCEHPDGKYPIYDARGIFVTYVCAKCEKEKLSHYRPEIFTNSNYETTEPIDDETYY